MAKGYAEGPAAEEAERRRDELELSQARDERERMRSAVYGATKDDSQSHFIGWRDDVDPDKLFSSGKAWGLTVRRVPPG